MSYHFSTKINGLFSSKQIHNGSEGLQAIRCTFTRWFACDLCVLFNDAVPNNGAATPSMDVLFNSSCFTAEQIGDHREFMKREGNESTKQIYVYNAHQRETEVYSSQEVSAIAELCKCAASPPRQLRLGGIVGCFLTQFMGGVNMILLSGLIFNVELDYYGPCI